MARLECQFLENVDLLEGELAYPVAMEVDVPILLEEFTDDGVKSPASIWHRIDSLLHQNRLLFRQEEDKLDQL